MELNNGKEGELIAILDYTKRGYEIYIPIGVGHCDFIAANNGELVRVEVKSTKSTRDDRKTQSLDLRRQKANTTKERKNFDSSKSDEVFIVNLVTGNKKILKSADLEGRKFIRI